MELKVNKKQQPISTILQEIDRLRQTGIDVANLWIMTSASDIKALQDVDGILRPLSAPRVDFAIMLEAKMIAFKQHKFDEATMYEVAWIVNNSEEDYGKSLCQSPLYTSRLLHDKDGEEMLLIKIV